MASCGSYVPVYSRISAVASSPVASKLEHCHLLDISPLVLNRISKILDSVPCLFLSSLPQLSNQHHCPSAMCPEPGSSLHPPFLSGSGVESISSARWPHLPLSLGPSSLCVSSVTSPARAPPLLPGLKWPSRNLPAFSLSPSNSPPHNHRVILKCRSDHLLPTYSFQFFPSHLE